ncbi:MAG TPA: tyrosine-type recombinase/integrase [Terriglobales bacterium]|nr:tyrosine-type recombinase/integrase [Terriglobales bacterium]
MLIKEFVEYLTARGCSGNTVSAYRTDLQQFEMFLRDHRVRCTAVQPRHIQEFSQYLIEARGGHPLAPATIWRKLASVSSYYEFIRYRSNGKINNPVPGVPRPRRRRSQPNAIDEAAIQQVLAGISNVRDRAMVCVFLASGLRLAELHGLNRDSISVERKPMPDGSIRVLGVGSVIGKGNKQRLFLVDLGALDVLTQYLRTRHDACPALFISNRGQRISRREIQHIFSMACEHVGLPRHHVHQLRHAYAERLANAGIPAIVLKDLMGHASFNTTQGYFRIKRQRLTSEYFAAMELVPHAG